MDGKKFVKALAVVAGCVLLALAVWTGVRFFTGTLDRHGVTHSSGTFVNRRGRLDPDGWIVTAARANGETRISVDFDENDFRNFAVSVMLNEGKAALFVSQGDEVVALGFDAGYVFVYEFDFYGFMPGEVELRLVFEEAEGVDARLYWEY